MKIQVKRVYAAVAIGDGKRILIDRLWPRGLSKAKAAVAGAYIFGHEVRSFQPCGSTKIYWTKAVSPKISARLRKRHTELSARPYGRIYVVVSGTPTDEKTTGFAEFYAGYFEISELLKADGQIPPGCAIH